MSYTSASLHDRINVIFDRTKVIAVVGWSPHPARPSARVAGYLRRAGFDVIPVNPNVDDIDGVKAFARLEDIPGPVDLVVIFRRSEEAEQHIDEALRKHARAIWLQEGVTSHEGAAKAAAAGVDYVEDKCAMVEHRLRFHSVM
jgi:predicted CoA-binding protein